MYRISNIEPYNKLFFNGCYYNALFSILAYKKRSILPFLVSQVPRYYYCRENREFGIKYEIAVEGDQVINKLGLTKVDIDNSIEKMVEAITNDEPLIMGIDWFYMPHQKDTFQKKHKQHVIEAVGFDSEKQLFQIYDQEHTDALNYKEFIITAEQLERAARWSCKFVDNNYNNKDSYTDLNDELRKECLQTFKQNYLNRELLYKCRINILDEILSDTNNIFNFYDIANSNGSMNIMKGLNEIINHKVVETEILLILKLENSNIIQIISETQKQWRSIRNKVYKSILKKRINSDDIQLISDALLKNIQLERELADTVYNNL